MDDSAGWGLDVAAGLTPTASGTYLVTVTSAFAGETEAYALWIREGLPPDTVATVTDGVPDPVSAVSGLMGPLLLGDQVSAALTAAGQRVAFHTYFVDVPRVPRA